MSLKKHAKKVIQIFGKTPHCRKKNVYLQPIIDTSSTMKQDFITVKTFAYPGDVPVVQSYMAMCGIETYMKNFTANRLAYPLGGIEMQVKTEDFERAKQALIDGGFSKPEDFE